MTNKQVSTRLPEQGDGGVVAWRHRDYPLAATTASKPPQQQQQRVGVGFGRAGGRLRRQWHLILEFGSPGECQVRAFVCTCCWPCIDRPIKIHSMKRTLRDIRPRPFLLTTPHPTPAKPPTAAGQESRGGSAASAAAGAAGRGAGGWEGEYWWFGPIDSTKHWGLTD